MADAPLYRTFLRTLTLTTAVAVVAVISALPAAAAEVPYKAVATDDNVAIRAGAGGTFYTVGKLEPGQIVTVEEVVFNWYKIRPPAGVFSYVAKAAVDLEGAAPGVGTVKSDRTAVYAADVAGPGDSYRKQLNLNEGDTVKVVAEEGAFYRIQPPDNARVYVEPDALRPATEEEIEAAMEPVVDPVPESPPAEETDVETNPPPVVDPPVTDTDPQDSDPPVEAPDDSTGDDTTTDDEDPDPVGEEPDTGGEEETDPPITEVTPEVPDADTPAEPDDDSRPTGTTTVLGESEAVRDAERRFAAAMEKPLEKRPVESLLTVYEVLSKQPDLSRFDQRIVAFRIRTLRRDLSVAQALRNIEQTREDIAESAARMPERSETDKPVEYDAVGLLIASGVYDGQRLPRLYRLVDPANRRTLAYIEPGEGWKPAEVLGQVVGVVGDRVYDQALKLRVLVPEQIDRLEASRGDKQTP